MRGSNRSQLAKLTRPRLHEVLARTRLFDLLDACRQRSVCWVVGPPGAGKTALVGSYLESRTVPGVWYHVDPEDSDLATFFHFLSLAIKDSIGRKRDRLPVMHPEHLNDVGAFSRYYFRTFFSRWSTPAVLVFDNYHELPADSPLHVVLAQAAKEIPDGVSMIFISREDPPVEFSRLDALDRVARVEWPLLKLTLDEAQAIAARRFELDRPALLSLYDISQGWAAGLTLALERMKRTQGESQDLRSEAHESVFDYFAGQIFKTVQPEIREFLMRTALLNRMTPEIAQQVSGQVNAAAILDDLYRRRLFTDRRGTRPITYQYHDLFRVFLLNRLEQMYTPMGLADLRQRAARVLEERQRHEESFHLYREAQDWEAITRLIRERAPSLLAQGRGGTIRDWSAALPKHVREQSPWVAYWLGVALVEFAPDDAIAPLENAHGLFLAAGDAGGQLAACAAAASSLLIDFKSLKPLTLWIDRIMLLLRDGAPFPSVSVELQVNASIAHYHYLTLRPGIDVEATLDRARALLASDLNVNDKTVPACTLIDLLRESGRLHEAEEILNLLRELIASPELSPANKATTYMLMGWYHMSAGDRNAAVHVLRISAEICDAHALMGPERDVLRNQGLASMAWQAGDLATAEVHVAKMDSNRRTGRLLEQGWAAWIKGLIAGDRGDWQSALNYSLHEFSLMRACGARFHEYFANLHVANAHIGLKQFAQADHAIHASRAILVNTSQYRNLADVDLLEAWLALHQDDRDRFTRCVTAAVDLLYRTEVHACLWYLPPRIMSMVLSTAMERRIEADRVRQLIHQLKIQPPNRPGPAWPWPIRIRSFGTFEILRHELPMEPTRKPAKKPLALLKALLCANGEAVPLTRLADWLWPESEADAAQKSLEMALHRLRALLGDAEYLILSDGKLRLDQTRVWVDAWAFEQASLDCFDNDVDLAWIVQIYRGPFLQHDVDAAWSISYRERLHDRFNHLISTQAAKLEASARFTEALKWYQRGLEADDAVESMYQGIMRCQLQLGQRSDVLTAFQRLRRTLAAKLKTVPSRDSVALAAAAEAITP